MLDPDKELKAAQEELKWIDVNKKPSRKDRPWNLYDVLVPAGCVVTAGILASGIYQMLKRDSKKQQKFMRYRILSQGVTILLATASIFQYRLKSS